MGRKRKGLPIDGVVLLDKPVGMSSNAALQTVRRLFNAQKAGHTGTLDPLASGLLPLCFGEATKFSADLLDAPKEYVADIRIGARTTTGDLEGEVVETGPSDFPVEKIEEVLESFKGEIEQVPPMYSALKKDGVALYQLARKGEIVERAPRKVVISRLELLKASSGSIQIRVECSKGTYIRVLAEDIGKALGSAAHLTALRRTKVGKETIENSVTLEDLQNADETALKRSLFPVDKLISTLPVIELEDFSLDRFSHGGAVKVQGSTAKGRVRVYGKFGSESRLMGCGRLSDDGVLTPERLVTFND